MNLAIEILPHGEGLPALRYETPGSAGADLRAANDAPMTVYVGGRTLIPCGFRMAIPPGFEAQIRPRSGLALKYGITVANAPATIDSDYRGEIKAILVNLGPSAFTVERGMRVAQLVIAPVVQVTFDPLGKLDDTERGYRWLRPHGRGVVGKPRAVNIAAIQSAVEALGELPNRAYVPMALWGRDHYSTLAYLECRVVDHGGIVDKTKMRCDSDRHPGLAFRLPFSGMLPDRKYPTILAGGVELHDHDDWDAADDLCVAGLIEKHGTGLHPIVKLTEQGELVAAALRAHKGAGGNFADFRFGR